jgi:hypothetical protein
MLTQKDLAISCVSGIAWFFFPRDKFLTSPSIFNPLDYFSPPLRPILRPCAFYATLLQPVGKGERVLLNPAAAEGPVGGPVIAVDRLVGQDLARRS